MVEFILEVGGYATFRASCVEGEGGEDGVIGLEGDVVGCEVGEAVSVGEGEYGRVFDGVEEGGDVVVKGDGKLLEEGEGEEVGWGV